MPKAAFRTFGCKVNQYETQKLRERFAARGFEIVRFTDDADVYVINSCTVTHTADSKVRQAVRNAAGRGKGVVVLTGCYAEILSGSAGCIDGAGLVLGNSDKESLVEKVIERFPHLNVTAPEIEHAGGRTRALLMVQDGCDQFCAYCAVPLARPVMRSIPFDSIVKEAEGLAGCGHKEIVLTGIRLGRFEDEKGGLADLLEALSAIQGIERIRLSSIELTDIPGGLIELMAGDRKICRHLHIPLQSGDDEILRRMNRPYSTKEFAEFVENARSAVPDLAVTTDVMVGFPGETEEHFSNSYNFVKETGFSRLHVFQYSQRPNTTAAGMEFKVHPKEKGRRSAALIELGKRCMEDFAARLIGTEVSVLVEGKTVSPGINSGLTGNYVRVYFPAVRGISGEIVNIHVENPYKDGVCGRVVWADAYFA